MNTAQAIDYRQDESQGFIDSLRDPETGLPGVDLFWSEGVKDLAYAQRHCKDLALICFHLDLRADGARLLCHRFVNALRGAVRVEDTIARLDRFRFAVLARETNAASARMLTRRVLARLREQLDPHENFRSISAGLAVPCAYRCRDFSEIIELGERCLDKAIAAGGGRVVAARSEESLRKLSSRLRRGAKQSNVRAVHTATTGAQNVNIAMWLISEGFIDQIEPHEDVAERFAPMLHDNDRKVDFDVGNLRVQLSRS